MRTIVFLGAAAAGLLIAQVQTVESRRATIKGQSGDWGKCTVEVVVDVAAEVEIYGDTAQLRTLGGQPSQWRRLECNRSMSSNPTDFKFAGLDGRGRQTLVQDPRQGQGVAIVRIEDSKGGSEGYTFEVQWRGGTAPASGSFPGSYFPRGAGYQAGGAYTPPAQLVTSCQNAVRDRAVRDYGVRALAFGDITADTTSGRQDRLVGTFETGGLTGRDSYRFACQMDQNSVQVRSVELTRAPSGGLLSPVGTAHNILRACQDAATVRTQQNGFSDVMVRWADSDNRPGRQDRVEGTVSARGRDGYQYFIDFSCLMDRNSGEVRSVDVRQR